MGSQVGWGTSKEFTDIVKAIGEAKSKAEEERIVTAEIETLKKKIAEPDVPRKKMKEYIIRLVYVEMLGHDASFGYIHAVKMTHDDNLLLKKTGYLAVTLFLNEDHDLIILIVNTIQKDLRSDNYLVCCAALTAVCKLINEETIPAVLPQVVDLLQHPKELVKKKAVMALHRFYQRAPHTVSHLLPKFEKSVCDADPSVTSAALCALFDLITADPRPYKNMTGAFVNILKQVAERRLPKPYDYHGTPAPFIQIKLLKILALLGAGDKPMSDNMYNVLGDVIKKNDTHTNIGHAILYEAICTITSIYPHPKLLETAAEITSRFLKDNNHNLKYMGIDALGRVIKINPEFAEEHQLAVIDCLEDPDDTLKRKTLDLLYKMTRSSNVEVIVDRMIGYMRTINDSHNKTEIASRIIELAERFAPSNQWFIQTMNQVFELAGDLVPTKVAHDLMRLIAEGAGEEDEDADSQLRSSAVESYLQVLAEPKLPSILLQVICWVLGEYGIADGTYSAFDIIAKLCDVIEAHPADDAVKGYAVTAITKICAFEISAGKRVQLLPEYRAVVDELAASHSTDLQQRAYELMTFLDLPADVVATVMPMDASCEDIEIDKSLSFLSEIVETALANGARPYAPEHERMDLGGLGTLIPSTQNGPSSSLKFEAYERPVIPTPVLTPVQPTPLINEFEDQRDRRSLRTPHPSHSISIAPELDLINPESTRLRLDGVQRKWGRQTYSTQSSTTSADRDRSSNGAAGASDRGGSYAKDSGASQYESSRSTDRRKPVEISSEKQKLAASLFGGPSGSRVANTGNAVKPSRTAAHKSQVPRGGEKHQSSRSVPGSGRIADSDTSVPSSAPVPQAPPPDLLDLTDGETGHAAPLNDPFKLLEGLVDPQVGSSSATSAPPVKADVDLMSLYGPGQVISSGDGGSQPSGLTDMSGLPVSPLIGLTGVVVPNTQPGGPSVGKKGPSPQGSLQKDATARQAGVTPTVVNPDLFKDLLG
ncbi:AP-4 complex subunit epsilon-1 [Marchantia polymorpha subsp. ruderalis]|uniref:Clathrin/coatomer adaptor adaptin-like N-terminal domain-containing protein n=2 Tax=Marchantia polymorpha TaxID=3197 RepID=A0AAF6B8C6_MARPO|nr:hypothetical protein MARPO_0011s0005 [Marchantia polymorpha]BBN08260.1 hypothetical protein Mp_4g10170 [Marchantia polymorpha subsp. ruderalis]|eukprot:PTQ46297.1 hypothetical protein MARPO_0011s0005 [Marchantia polymorpha]